MTMTSVLGHLTELEFDANMRDWHYPPPIRLFDAPVHIKIGDVRAEKLKKKGLCLIELRRNFPLREI